LPSNLKLEKKIPCQLTKGRAEIFGFELAEGKVYLFAFECKAAIYTWQGCVLEISVSPYG
jgi:polyribonucleotide 5'-hydroxyl-kinase